MQRFFSIRHQAATFRGKIRLAFMLLIIVFSIPIPLTDSTNKHINKQAAEVELAVVSLNGAIDLQQSVSSLQQAAASYIAAPNNDAYQEITYQAESLKRKVNSTPNVGKKIQDQLFSVPEGVDEAVAILGNGKSAPVDGAARLEEFNAAIQEKVQPHLRGYAQANKSEVERVNEALVKRTSTGSRTTIASLVVALLLCCVLAITMPMWLVRRLELLGGVTRRFAHGDLTARADFGGKDEIGELADDFNAMAQTLELRDLRINQLLELERDRASRDSLTHLHNHGYFHKALRKAIETAETEGSILSIAVLDIDNFKQVNDRFGHGVGDSTLKAVAVALVENVRGDDIVCRIGGEEFAVILPGAPATRALRILDRIATSIRDCGPEDEDLTFSAGIACFPRDANSAEWLFDTADHRAYSAKESGKDRILIADNVDTPGAGSGAAA